MRWHQALLSQRLSWVGGMFRGCGDSICNVCYYLGRRTDIPHTALGKRSIWALDEMMNRLGCNTSFKPSLGTPILSLLAFK